MLGNPRAEIDTIRGLSKWQVKRIVNLDRIRVVARGLKGLTYEYARVNHIYLPETGQLFKKWSGLGKLHEIKRVNKGGYIEAQFNGRVISGHRLAWLLYYGKLPPARTVIDHINQDKLDNRIDNLRIASYQENAMNSRHRKVTEHRYIYWNNKLHRFEVNIEGIFIGTYDDLDSAKSMRDTCLRSALTQVQ
jgi:hypothetical protein